MNWKKYISSRRVLAAFAFLTFICSAGLGAQELVPGLETRRMPMYEGDTLLAEFVYADAPRAPFIVILPDRYGVQISTRQLMRAWADAGYNIAALHLLSQAGPDGNDTSFAVKLRDAGRIVQAVVDIRNDPRGTDRAGLMAFDVGAVSGIMAEARIPLFAACTVFYPSERDVFLDALGRCNIPVEVNLGKEEDTLFPESGMFELKMRFGSKPNPILFRYYDAGGFFYNPGHPGFDGEATRRSVDQTALFFGRYLR